MKKTPITSGKGRKRRTLTYITATKRMPHLYYARNAQGGFLFSAANIKAARRRINGTHTVRVARKGDTTWSIDNDGAW